MDNLEYIISLAHLPRWRTKNINELSIRIIEERKLSFDEFFEFSSNDLRECFYLNEKEINDIYEAKNKLEETRQLVKELQNNNIEIIPFFSEDYPKTLKENLKITFGPPILYAKGNKEILHQKKIAVVGARNISKKGIEFTKTITKKLIEQNNVIVSGGAKGADQLALETALENDGEIIVILPQGILTYGYGFRKYLAQIQKGKVLILSTFFPKSQWNAGLAMARNRYVYGLANNIYVAETQKSTKEKRSGTWEGVLDGVKKIEQFDMQEYRKIFVRFADETEKCANNELINYGTIAIDQNFKEINKGKYNKQATLFR